MPNSLDSFYQSPCFLYLWTRSSRVFNFVDLKTILITGGAGFIGSHVVRLFCNKYPGYQVVNLDKLTYAGNLENLADVANHRNYTFVKGDIFDPKLI